MRHTVTVASNIKIHNVLLVLKLGFVAESKSDFVNAKIGSTLAANDCCFSLVCNA